MAKVLFLVFAWCVIQAPRALFAQDADANSIGLQIINHARDKQHLEPLAAADDLALEAQQCAEYYGRNRKLGNCPYYEPGTRASMSFFSSSNRGTPANAVKQAFSYWAQRGTISSGYIEWLVDFGIGVDISRSGTYVVAVMAS